MEESIYRLEIPNLYVGKPQGDWEAFDFNISMAKIDNRDLEMIVKGQRTNGINKGVLIYN